MTGVQEAALTWLPLVGALALWEIATRSGWLSALFFPAPTTILMTFLRMLQNGSMVANAGVTISRVLFGLMVGGLPGLGLGLLLGSASTLRRSIDPLVAAAHPIPKLAIFPLIIVIFGLGETSKVVVIAISAFFPMFINAMAAVREIVPIHFEVARNYGANRWQTFTRVLLPGSMPLNLAGARLALNTALLICIAVELIQPQAGLGAQIWMAWQTLRIEELYASLLTIALLGIAFNLIIQGISVIITPWKMESNA